MSLRRYEKDERAALAEIRDAMNTLHANMGGRSLRPERVALCKCMRILQKEIDRDSGRENSQ